MLQFLQLQNNTTTRKKLAIFTGIRLIFLFFISL